MSVLENADSIQRRLTQIARQVASIPETTYTDARTKVYGPPAQQDFLDAISAANARLSTAVVSGRGYLGSVVKFWGGEYAPEVVAVEQGNADLMQYEGWLNQIIGAIPVGAVSGVTQAQREAITAQETWTKEREPIDVGKEDLLNDLKLGGGGLIMLIVLALIALVFLRR
jgi:hypothetical protein